MPATLAGENMKAGHRFISAYPIAIEIVTRFADIQPDNIIGAPPFSVMRNLSTAHRTCTVKKNNGLG